MVAIVGLALLAPEIVPYDPLHAEPQRQFQPPRCPHCLGTDQLGRDVLSRALCGARNSLGSAALSSTIVVGLGLAIGGLAGSLGGWVDWMLMRIVDVLLAFPGLLLAMAMVGIIGTGAYQVAVAVGISLFPVYSRLVRAAVLSARVAPFIEAVRVLGAGRWHIFWRHLLPNSRGQIVALATVVYAWSLLNIAALDFLGLGGSPSVVTWGRMLNEGRAFLHNAPWIALAPGIMLTVSIIALIGISERWRGDAQEMG